MSLLPGGISHQTAGDIKLSTTFSDFLLFSSVLPFHLFSDFLNCMVTVSLETLKNRIMSSTCVACSLASGASTCHRHLDGTQAGDAAQGFATCIISSPRASMELPNTVDCPKLSVSVALLGAPPVASTSLDRVEPIESDSAVGRHARHVGTGQLPGILQPLRYRYRRPCRQCPPQRYSCNILTSYCSTFSPSPTIPLSDRRSWSPRRIVLVFKCKQANRPSPRPCSDAAQSCNSLSRLAQASPD